MLGKMTIYVLQTSLVIAHSLLACTLVGLISCMWMDQKVLKLLAYLCEYTTELYETYTEY